MTTKIVVIADIPEYQRDTHHVRVYTETDQYHKLQHGERCDAYVWDGRHLVITEEPNEEVPSADTDSTIT